MSSNEKEQEIYFIILIPSEEKLSIDPIFTSEIAPRRIYQKRIEKGKGSFLEHNVFELIKKKSSKDEKSQNEKEEKKGKSKKEKDKKKYIITYTEGEDAYDIIFSVKDNSFIFDAELKKGNKWLDNIIKDDIDQTIIPLYEKLDIFLEALKQKNESNKIQKLFDETISLYEHKKKFSLLISLFLKLYEENKDLCIKLLDIFQKINDKENTDKDKELEVYLEKIKGIYSEEADNIIKTNKYDPISFYGILFCYLCSYDKENFPKTIKEFSEGNADTLYEILIIYYSHFKIPLNQDKKFYNNFIDYAIKKKKDVKIIERILNYIDDIETFLYTINENREDLLKNYDQFEKEPIKLSSNLKLIKREAKDNEKKEIDTIINLIEEIIKFSKKNNKLILYLKTEFWINLLRQYNKYDMESINSCYRLRDLFKEYKNLIDILYTDTKDDNKINIQKDITRYYLRDEFAFTLNDNIKKCIEEKKDALKSEQKLGLIQKYNPYYNIENEDDIERYKNNREIVIFNNIDFKKASNAFKQNFVILNFEKMFEENLQEFINTILSKIEDIPSFGTVMEIISVDRLRNKKKVYYDLLKEKYESVIVKEITKLKGVKETELDETVKILSKFISRIFLEEGNINFLDEKISKLDEHIKPLIYNELVKTYNDEKFEKMKQYIYDIFLNKLEDIENIIKLMDSLSSDDQKSFLTEILKKCEFTKDEFYSNSENKK